MISIQRASLLQLWVIARYLEVDVDAISKKHMSAESDELLSLIVERSGQLKGNLPVGLKSYCERRGINLFT